MSALPADPVMGLHPGTVVAGRYRVRDVIGVGGMGAVAVVDDLFLRKAVALKVLLPQYAANQQAVERFQREVAMAHAVTHPGIARTYDMGQHEGALFFTMEYLEGESLKQRIQRQGKLSVAETRHVGLRLCAALQAAHDAGIIHRDLKPSNIMLVPDARQVVIMDFGISGSTREAHGPQSQPQLPEPPPAPYRQPTQVPVGTQGSTFPGYADDTWVAGMPPVKAPGGTGPSTSGTGPAAGGTGPSGATDLPDWDVTSAGMGTPPYMAPEQWHGKPSTPATDVYALGTILFECLTGKTVFESDGGPYGFLLAHLKHEPRRLRSLDPSLPAELDALIARTQKKEPAERYQSPRALAVDLAGRGGARAVLRLAGEGLLALLLLAALAYGLTRFGGSALIGEMRPGVACLAELTSEHVERIDLDAIHTADDASRPEFAQLCAAMDRVAAIHPAISYIYILRQVEGSGWEVVADHDYEAFHEHGGEDHMVLHGGPTLSTGTRFVTDHPGWIAQAMATAQPTAQDEFAHDNFGYMLSGFAPVGETPGEGEYVLGVDLGSERLDAFRLTMLALCGAAWLVMLVVISVRQRRRRADPLRGLYA